MSLIHAIEADLLAMGATDIEIRQTGTGARRLLASYTLRGKPASVVVPVPNVRKPKVTDGPRPPQAAP